MEQAGLNCLRISIEWARVEPSPSRRDPAGLGAYLFGGNPPGRTGRLGGALAMYDALGCAHVAGYDAIHGVHARHGWPKPMVSTNTSAIGVYELDLMLLDVLTGASALDGPARQFADALAAAPRAGYGPVSAAFERTSTALLRRARARGAVLSRTRAAVAASGRERMIDWVAADWYTPFLTEFLRRPGRAAPGSVAGSGRRP